MLTYTLDGETPVPCHDLAEWGEWMATADRVIRRSEIHTPGTAEPVVVSTVFLGMDHGFGRQDRPVLWESMVFGGRLNERQERYTSHADAVAGHEALLAELRG